MVRHCLVIRHPTAPLILLLHGGNGYVLPCITTEDRHTAEVDHINAAIARDLGIETIFLRSLHHDEDANADPIERCHELVARSGDLGRSGAVWRDPALHAAIAALAEPQVPHDGRDWEQPSWWDEATTWVGAVLRARGATVRSVVQLRAWPSSSVLRVRASDGDYYYKAVATSIARECAITAYLAERFPGAVPEVVASDRSRRSFLMRAVNGQLLENANTASVWEHAIARYAELQVASCDHVDALRECGASERGLASLAGRLESLGDQVRARPMISVWQRMCTELSRYDMPATLEHGDLWPGNFLVDGSRAVVIDWEDAAIAHPFFSLAPFLIGLQTYQPALATPSMTDRVISSYLRPFASYAAPEDLRAAIDLAIPLAFCDMVLRYRQQPPSVVRLHPWMRDLVPEALQRAIAATTYDGPMRYSRRLMR